MESCLLEVGEGEVFFYKKEFLRNNGGEEAEQPDTNQPFTKEGIKDTPVCTQGHC